jgi:hypothetical protein
LFSGAGSLEEGIFDAIKIRRLSSVGGEQAFLLPIKTERCDGEKKSRSS